MRPTFYLNLQVCSQEDDYGWQVKSEKIVGTTKSIDLAYLLYNLVGKYEPDDSFSVKDDAQPQSRE